MSNRKLLERRRLTPDGRIVRETSEEEARDLWQEGVGALSWGMIDRPACSFETEDGLTIADMVMVAEEMGRTLTCAPLTAAVVARLMPPCENGEATRLSAITSESTMLAWCWAPGATAWGGNQQPVSVRGTEDRMTVSGSAPFTLAAGSPSAYLLVARWNGEPWFVSVPADSGPDISEHATFDLTRSLQFVTFKDAPIDRSCLLAPATADLVDLVYGTTALLLCADSVGAMERVVELCVAYAKDRRQFKRPIGSFQALKHQFADMEVQLQTSRAVTYAAAAQLVQQRYVGGIGPVTAVRIAKAHVGRAFSAVASQAVQLMGGVGFCWDYDMHLFLRRARTSEALLGRPQFHDFAVANLSPTAVPGFIPELATTAEHIPART